MAAIVATSGATNRLVTLQGGALVPFTTGDTLDLGAGLLTAAGGLTVSSGSLTLNSGASVTAILDSDTMVGASATTLATSESIKAYVDASASAGWTVLGDSGGGRVISGGDSLTLAGGAGITSVDSATDTVTFNLDASNTTQTSLANLATVGALTSGSIGVGFGAINNAANTLTTGAATVASLQSNGTVTVGVDDTGYDVKFFGATTGKSWLWDESADKMIVTGEASVTGTITAGTLTDGTAAITGGAASGLTTIGSNGAATLDSGGTGSSFGGALDVATTLTVGAANDMVIGAGSITSVSGAITFDNENLITTGTLGAGATTVTTLGSSGASILDTGGTGSSFGGALTVAGDLTVNGTTVTVNTANMLVEDPLVIFATGQAGAPTQDSGIIVERGTSANEGMFWDESADVWSFVSTTEDGTTAGNVTITDYSAVHMGGLTADDASSFGGLLTANLGVTVTGAALTITNQAITQTTGGQVTFAGNVDAAAGVDVTGAALTTAVGITNTAGEVLISGGNLQLSDDIAASFGTADDATIYWDDSESTFLLTNGHATGTTAVVLGTDTSATKFQVLNSSFAQKFTVDASGQADFEGNLDANLGLDVSGGALTVDNQAITQTTGGQVTFAGNVNADSGVDVTGAALTAAAGLTVSAGAMDLDGTTFDLLASSTFSIDGTGASNVSATSGALTISTITSGALNLTSAADVVFSASAGNVDFSGVNLMLANVSKSADSVGYAAGDILTIDATGDFVAADASAASTGQVIGVAPAAAAADAAGQKLTSMYGTAMGSSTDLSAMAIGNVLYLSETAGAVTTVAPMTAGSVIYRVGVVLEVGTTAGDGMILYMPQYIATNA